MPEKPQDFSEVINRHWPGIYRLCLRMTGRPQDAEEVAQQSFFLAFRAWENFEGRSEVKTWLYRIAINACREYLTRRGAGGELLVEPVAHDENRLETAEKEEVVRRALNSLPPQHRLILTLFVIEDLAHKDIADILKCPEGTVWSRLYSAKQALEAALKRMQPDLWNTERSQ